MPSFIIVGYVWPILGKGVFLPPALSVGPTKIDKGFFFFEGIGGGDGGLIFVKIAETYSEPHQTFKILIGKIKRITEAFLEPY